MRNNPIFIQAEKEVNELRDMVQKANQDVHDALATRFKANGGCEQCLGRGWVVVWDTMDCMDGSYAEYGRCENPNCTEATRAISGLYPSHSRYDMRKGIHENPMNSTPEWKAVVGPLQKLLREAQMRLDQVKVQLTPSKGKTARVIRGRKVPVGTVGQIFWIGDGEYGKRVGLKDARGTVHWTAMDNVEVVL